MAAKRTDTRRVRFKTLLSSIEAHADPPESLALGALVARYSRRYDERPVAAQLRKSLKNYLDFATKPGSRDETHDQTLELLGELEERAGHVWDFYVHRPQSPRVQLVTWRGYAPRSAHEPPIPSDEMMVLALGVAVVKAAGASSSLDACGLVGDVMRVAGIRKGRAKAESLRVDESQARTAIFRILEAPDWAATVKAYVLEGRKLCKINPWVKLAR